ncbi:uncharacterized protein DDB_G0284459-like [Gadus macrocephalus]|uniref:uncharacterized protein DDB_G0284459-like n=1 Tax=Gadus macrocephalus TaxID=80720 RepID=UPI0028CB7CED|nr:uncharacterized protein DDB_G0284459-like [Gadus macrocephalus]
MSTAGMTRARRCAPWLSAFLCASVTLCLGALGEEREAGARVTCRQPCEEFLGVLTEIQGLRLVTSNLLEDLQKVVYENEEMRLALAEMDRNATDRDAMRGGNAVGYRDKGGGGDGEREEGDGGGEGDGGDGTRLPDSGRARLPDSGRGRARLPDSDRDGTRLPDSDRDGARLPDSDRDGARQ